MALFSEANVLQMLHDNEPMLKIADAAKRERHEGTIWSELAKKVRAVQTFDIFLSHSYADAHLIRGIYYGLTKTGFSVYVDWIYDPQLSRNNVNAITANTVRNRIKQSKSLLFVTTPNSPASKWMPWECGVMDGYKDKVAILPITKTPQQTYQGQEYLGIYPYIDGNLNVYTPGGSLLDSLGSWIR